MMITATPLAKVSNVDPQLLNGLEMGLRERPCELDAEIHTTIVRRVMAMYQACKRDQPAASKPYQPTGEWSDYLAERQGFYDSIMADDFEFVSEKLANFWRNELGPIVKEYAKYEQLMNEEAEFIERFTRNVTRNYAIWSEIFGANPTELDVPKIGNPWGIYLGDQFVVPKATRFHALSTQITDLTNDIQHPIISEIGAGYGGQAYYLLRNREDVTYIDFDLPETLTLAAYYLLCCLPDRKVFLYGEGQTPTGEATQAYSAVLLPNFEMPKLTTNSVDLVLNSFSFSEMGADPLHEYCKQVARAVRGYFLHNNMDRTGVINRGFERIPASQYPINSTLLKRVYKHYDLFHGHNGDYREFLYQKRAV